jgi:hypothetical protein
LAPRLQEMGAFELERSVVGRAILPELGREVAAVGAAAARQRAIHPLPNVEQVF